jgi:hypothetical protein
MSAHGYRAGDLVEAFHPAMFGVVKVGRIAIVGRAYLHVDFGPLGGGVWKVSPRNIVGHTS